MARVKEWEARIRPHLIGRKITGFRYDSACGQNWPVIELDNGSVLMLQADDEGNGPGAAIIAHADNSTTPIPELR